MLISSPTEEKPAISR